MSLPIVTISREFGSHGHEIGEQVARQLGVELYDRKIIMEAAEESGLSTEFIEKNEQKSQHRFFNCPPFGGCMIWEPSMLDRIYIAQHNVITRLAEKGPCVFVGRAADFILSERPDVMNVFVYAALECRIQYAIRKHDLEPAKVKREIRMIDNQRAMYYNSISSRTWGARENYHLMVDSGVFNVDVCADIICRAAQNFIQSDKNAQNN